MEQKRGTTKKLADASKTMGCSSVRALGKDFSEISFGGMEEFAGFLDEKEKNTSRAYIKAEDISFSPMTEASEKRLAKRFGDLAEDTALNTGLTAKIGGKEYLIGVSAMKGLKEKAFARFDAIPAKQKAYFLNAAISAAADIAGVQDGLLPMVTCGKLEAVTSGAYVPIIPSEFFASVCSTIAEAVGEFSMESAAVSATEYRMSAVFEGEKAEELRGIYTARIKQYAALKGGSDPISFCEDTLKFGFTCGTDETGSSSAYVRPYVSVAGNTAGFQVGSPVAMYHRGTAQLDDLFKASVRNIFSVFSDFIDRLADGVLVVIKNWRTVIDGACRTLRIPDETATAIITAFAKNYPNAADVTAYDVMMAVLTSAEIYRNIAHPSDTSLGRYEALVSGVVNLDLQKFDYDPAELEKELRSQVLNDPERVLTAACRELKLPKSVENSVTDGFASKIGLDRMMHGGVPADYTSWDIYEMLLGAPEIYRGYLRSAGKSAAETEEKAAVIEKCIRKARLICYIKYDAA